jgi:hypothetical protein
VDQAENWEMQPMEVAGGGTIPTEYTNSPYALEYYFELQDANGRTTIYPGLGPNLIQQPYFVVG